MNKNKMKSRQIVIITAMTIASVSCVNMVDSDAHPGIFDLWAAERSGGENMAETLPPGVFMATFANGYRMRSDAQFIGNSWNTEGHTATAGELAAQGFTYTEKGGAFIKSPIDDRSYALKPASE